MTSERQDVNRQCLAESLQTLAHAIDESYAPDVLASMNEAYRHLTIAMTLYDNPLRATPRAVPDETREAVGRAVVCENALNDYERCAVACESCDLAYQMCIIHPPRAGEVTEEMVQRGVAASQHITDQYGSTTFVPRDVVQSILTAALERSS